MPATAEGDRVAGYRPPSFDPASVAGRVLTAEEAAVLLAGGHLPRLAQLPCPRRGGRCDQRVASLWQSPYGLLLEVAVAVEPTGAHGAISRYELLGVSQPVETSAWCPRHGSVPFDRARLVGLVHPDRPAVPPGGPPDHS